MEECVETVPPSSPGGASCSTVECDEDDRGCEVIEGEEVLEEEIIMEETIVMDTADLIVEQEVSVATDSLGEMRDLYYIYIYIYIYYTSCIACDYRWTGSINVYYV